jgi:hydroxymethylpyrimidine pyrophosphatase-like HAD family hydrolase
MRHIRNGTKILARGIRGGRTPAKKDYLTIACDADGTLTWRHRLSIRTAGALVRWREAGGRLILVTGEIRDDLLHFARTGLFDRIVAENGGILLSPPDWRAHPLAKSPPSRFVHALRGRVHPLHVGRVLVATEHPKESILKATIRDLELDYQLVFNLKNVMALPAGVTKTSGLRAALKDIGVPASRVVAIGNGENDACIVRACGLGVAVSNAKPEVKRAADWITVGRGPDGVIEVIRRLLKKHKQQSTERALR